MIARYQTEGFACPAGYGSNFSPSSDYFFNAQIARRKLSSIHDAEHTVAFGDGPDNGPTNSHLWELPNDWNNEDSFTQRHSRGANYVFADGHVKWLRPQRFSEWRDDYSEKRQSRYKFSPDEAAFRNSAATSGAQPKAAKKRLNDLIQAARSSPKLVHG